MNIIFDDGRLGCDVTKVTLAEFARGPFTKVRIRVYIILVRFLHHIYSIIGINLLDFYNSQLINILK